jgi:hypothetical protein
MMPGCLKGPAQAVSILSASECTTGACHAGRADGVYGRCNLNKKEGSFFVLCKVCAIKKWPLSF